MVKYGELPENLIRQMDDIIAFYEMAIPSIFIIIILWYLHLLSLYLTFDRCKTTWP